MAYIAREDGTHFVIPSYRDVLSSKRKSALKKDIVLLSQSYGEYITMQKKGTAQFEVAFSPERGYLLGETVWHHFNRPLDMIYCEAIPNTNEAILVIVKAGSVYLDGSFPLESIPEELIIFLTQQNSFEIYIYGNVPISRDHADGKFSFEPQSIKSFTILDAPVFQKLPLLKVYQLELVDTVLKANGIGTLPIRNLLISAAILGALWMLWSQYQAHRAKTAEVKAEEASPYWQYNEGLMSPAPNVEITKIIAATQVLFGMPGWLVDRVDYTRGMLAATILSKGSTVAVLQNWLETHPGALQIAQQGIVLNVPIALQNRGLPTSIYPLQTIALKLIDHIGLVYPGNNISFGDFANKGAYSQAVVTIKFESVSPDVLLLIADQLKDMPLVLQSMTFNITNGLLTGTITLQAMGS